MNINQTRYKFLLVVTAIILFTVLGVVAYIVRNQNPNIVKKTYCSDVCPGFDIVEKHPFYVYLDVAEEDCEEIGGTVNTAYGWSNEYLGCTPEGYTTLEEATNAMWNDNSNN